MLLVERISDVDGLVALKPEWNRILKSSSSDCIFLTWEWVFNWWKVYGKGNQLYVLTVRDPKEGIVGFAPLYLRKKKILTALLIREIRFIGSGGGVSPDYLDFIIKCGHEKNLTESIAGYLCKARDWDLLNLTDSLASSISMANTRSALVEKGFKTHSNNASICPYIALPKTWEEFLMGLSKSTQYNIKRKIKKIEKNFDVSCFFCKTPHEIHSGMEHLAFLHKTRWETKGVKHGFSTTEYNTFHMNVAHDFAEKGWLQLACLKLGDDIVGIYYDYLYNSKLYYYQAGFDVSYNKYSPGIVLRAYIIQKAIGNGLHEIDLLKGAYNHKYMWTVLERNTINLKIFRNAFKGMLLYLWDAYAPQLKRILKKNLSEKTLAKIKKIQLRLVNK